MQENMNAVREMLFSLCIINTKTAAFAGEGGRGVPKTVSPSETVARGALLFTIRFLERYIIGEGNAFNPGKTPGRGYGCPVWEGSAGPWLHM